MKLRCWGTRGNIATPSVETLALGGNTSCYEVALGGGRSLVLDCGTGLIEYATWLLANKDAALPDEHHIVLTHFHWDHVLGFPFFHVIHRPGTHVHLYSAFAPAQLEAQVRALFDGTYSPLRTLDNLAARVSFHEIEPGGREIQGAYVRCARVDHSEPCYAVRIEHGGRSLCYATDHEARPSILNDRVVAFADRVNTLLHDAQYTAEEYPAHAGWGHSSMQAALENARDANVGRVLLTHHDPRHKDRFRQEYLTSIPQGRKLPSELARQSVWYEV